MRHRRGGLASVIAALLLTAASTVSIVGTASASPGDTLVEFDASVTAGVPPCSVNTGIAFDGESLILSCWYNNQIYLVDAETHASNGSVSIPGVSGINAMAYDSARDRLWICTGGYTVRLVDLNAGTLDPSFTPFTTSGCYDGLAYDGEDDTLWSSNDVSSTIQHYQVDGTLIASNSVQGLIGGCGNSGIAVGGEYLFLGNNGCSQIYQMPKDFSSSVLFASFPRRIEDLECDDVTFPGVGAIWAQDAYDRILTAYEIPPGLCSYGGASTTSLSSAHAARAKVGPLGVDTGDIGWVSARDEGSASESQISFNEAAPVATVEAGSASAWASRDPVSSASSATLTGVSIADGLIQAEALVVQASASFDAGVTTLSSEGTSFAGLTIDGEPQSQEVEPNTKIVIPEVGTVTLRREATSPEGTSLSVEGIVFESLDGSTQVVIGSAQAGAGTSVPSAEPRSEQLPELPELPPVPQILGPSAFRSSFEEGEAAEWQFTGSWAIGEAADAPDGSRIAATNPGGSYPSYDYAFLTSPTIDLSSMDDPVLAPETATLRFQQRFRSESFWDCGLIQVSTDGGANWSTIEPEAGYNYSSGYCAGTYFPQSYSGTVHPQWTSNALDLTPYAGQQVQVRFHFVSDGSIQGLGWDLDDFRLVFDQG